MSSNPQSILRLYACGGFGINVGKKYHPDIGINVPGYSTPAIAYLDTSRANLRGIEDESSVYLIKGPDGATKDGAGKIRSLHAQDIVPHINPILNQHKPGDMNVVICSASGGSGSVIGPLIAGELLARGLTVVVMVVGSSESAAAAMNTIRSINTLEGQVDRAKAPLVMAYEHNEPDRKRSEVDEIFHHYIAALSVLASRQNDEMDSTDILHTFRFDKATSVPPRLATLSIHRSNESLDPSAQYITMASLYADPDAPATTIRPDYHAAGYLPPVGIQGPPVFHFAVRVDEVRGIMARLQKDSSTFSGDSENRVLHERAVDSAAVDKATGLVL